MKTSRHSEISQTQRVSWDRFATGIQRNFKGYNLLDNLRGTMKINQPLMDSHLIPIPGFGPFTTRCLSGGDFQVLSWQSYWTLHLQLLFFSTLDQISTYLLQAFDIATGQCNPDSVDLSLFFWDCTLFLVVSLTQTLRGNYCWGKSCFIFPFNQ